MRELAVSRALAASTMKRPWLSNLLVTVDTCCSRFSDTFFKRSAWPERPSMALSDWRVTLSEVRRTASMPCSIEASKLLAWRPKVSDNARTWLSTAVDSSLAFSFTTVSMASVERKSESSILVAWRTSVSDSVRT